MAVIMNVSVKMVLPENINALTGMSTSIRSCFKHKGLSMYKWAHQLKKNTKCTHERASLKIQNKILQACQLKNKNK